jgi:hypothetical protein
MVSCGQAKVQDSGQVAKRKVKEVYEAAFVRFRSEQ